MLRTANKFDCYMCGRTPNEVAILVKLRHICVCQECLDDIQAVARQKVMEMEARRKEGASKSPQEATIGPAVPVICAKPHHSRLARFIQWVRRTVSGRRIC